MSSSLPPSYFDEVYRAKPDPWGFLTSPYEAAKYEATLAALPGPRYAHALEIGCSIGVLTARLADRCDHLLALDVAERALEQARARCADRPWVRFARRAVPEEFPPADSDGEPWDLVLVSEVGYYLALPDLRRLREKILASLRPGGDLLLVHWTPPVHDYPLTGDAVHGEFLATPPQELEHLHGSRTDQYRLDLFRRLGSWPGAQASSPGVLAPSRGGR